MLYIKGHKIIKGYVGNTPISHVGFGKSGLIKIKSENGGSDYPNNLIAKYTANASGILPTFDSGYQYTVNETESNGIYTVELSSDTDFSYCSFYGKSELLTVEYLKVTSNVTRMDYMFTFCSQLTQLDASKWDTSNVINMNQMFGGCYSLISVGDLTNWDVGNVANMYSMFYGCYNLTSLDVSNWDVGNVADMSGMFMYCESLTTLDVSKWDTSNVIDIRAMFYDCQSLTSLDVSNWDTSNVINILHVSGYEYFGLFQHCHNLKYIKGISNWDTGNITDMSWMFCNCSQLTQLDVSNFDTSKVTNMRSFIANTTALQSFISCAIPVSFEAKGTALTHDSLMSIINNLATVTKTQTLTLGSTNLAKLSSEEKAIATNKGWTLA